MPGNTISGMILRSSAPLVGGNSAAGTSIPTGSGTIWVTNQVMPVCDDTLPARIRRYPRETCGTGRWSYRFPAGYQGRQGMNVPVVQNIDKIMESTCKGRREITPDRTNILTGILRKKQNHSLTSALAYPLVYYPDDRCIHQREHRKSGKIGADRNEVRVSESVPDQIGKVGLRGENGEPKTPCRHLLPAAPPTGKPFIAYPSIVS